MSAQKGNSSLITIYFDDNYYRWGYIYINCMIAVAIVESGKFSGGEIDDRRRRRTVDELDFLELIKNGTIINVFIYLSLFHFIIPPYNIVVSLLLRYLYKNCDPHFGVNKIGLGLIFLSS